jgi:hypothetical protein
MSFGGLTNYHLKLLAAATMVVDHVGVVFYPDDDWFRIVGRISFPLFVWLLVQGETYTRNVWQYGLRLATLGIVSQPLYQVVLAADRPNILFQLLLGLICLRLTRRFSTFALPIWILGASVALLTETSYGAYGIALTAMTRYFQPTLIWWAVWAGVHLIWALDAGPFQLPVIGVPLLFCLANGKQGAKARWFYGFYPGHLALLWLAQQVFG